ncbi:hypothetical protein HYPDE_31133 [Hyphomicrobium denitrificans 1NES1]|uniref:Uncharacterized protein n=1 Tax=Hyphomicrobium denitrificans 1NES1 TaxID=670307 RepID=N0BBK1_9HYPH|nr:hypothetical protein [Hyphomicrobium denitrificans]AGK57901.1 hypothetical protein HYPDE_31133 [Hyphomicrobium denitrificans 1NES1]
MYRLPLIPALAVVLLMGIAPAAATAADSSADSKYTYKPYGQQNPAGSDAANSPANNPGSAAAGPGDTRPGDADGREPDRTYRDDARRAPGPNQASEPDEGNVNERADRPAPPPAAEQAPPSGFAEGRRIKATASAPDRSVPYSVREQDARRAAIEAWRSKAAERFGPEFSRWRTAERKQIDCVRDRGDDAVCTVSGVPARGEARFDRPYSDDRY